MDKNETLFRILSRQPWWVTVLVAVALFFVAQAVFPPVAPFVSIPFVLVAAWIGVQQLRGVSTPNAAERLAELREMSWDEFGGLVAAAYRKAGYEVGASRESGHDFTLKQGNRVTLVQCRRWKVNQVGVAPVRELADAVHRLDAYNGICITTDAFSPKAVAYARGVPVTLLAGTGLVELVGAGNAKRRWFGKP